MITNNELLTIQSYCRFTTHQETMERKTTGEVFLWVGNERLHYSNLTWQPWFLDDVLLLDTAIFGWYLRLPQGISLTVTWLCFWNLSLGSTLIVYDLQMPLIVIFRSWFSHDWQHAVESHISWLPIFWDSAEHRWGALCIWDHLALSCVKYVLGTSHDPQPKLGTRFFGGIHRLGSRTFSHIFLIKFHGCRQYKGFAWIACLDHFGSKTWTTPKIPLGMPLCFHLSSRLARFFPFHAMFHDGSTVIVVSSWCSWSLIVNSWVLSWFGYVYAWKYPL